MYLSEDTPKLRGLRRRLVQQLRKSGIRDERVLAAMERVPRHAFVESALAERAYEDIPLPIGADQTISQPYTVAFQSALLRLQGGERVLEVGTGSGYQAAVLAELGCEVFSVERHLRLYRHAREILNALGYAAYLKHGDGSLGWPNYAPYDRILATAGSPGIPETLTGQLAASGLLVIPVGDRESQRMKLVQRTGAGEFDVSDQGAFKFVPLLGESGWPGGPA